MKQQFKRLLSASVIYGVGSVLNQFLNLLLLPLFTSYLHPSDYGVLSVLSIYMLIVTNLFALGLGGSIGLLYYEGNSEIQKNRTIWSATTVLLFSGAIAILTSFIFGGTFSSLLFDSNIYSYFIFLSTINAVIVFVTIPFTLRMQFEEKQIPFIILTLISTLATVFMNVIFVVIMRQGVYGKIISGVLSSLLMLLLFAIFSMDVKRIALNFSIVVRLIKLGVPMIPSFLALYVLQQGNVFFLKKYTSIETVGLYSIGSSFGYASMIVFGAFATAFYPFAMSFSEKRDEARSLFGRIFTYYVFLGGMFTLLFYVAAKPAVMLFTNTLFFQSHVVIGLISTALWFLSMFNILLIPIYYEKDTKYITIIQLLASGIYTICAILLIPNAGLIGAGLSLVLGYLSMNVLTYLWSTMNKKYLSIEYEWKRVLIFFSSYCIIISIILVGKKSNIVFELTFGIFLMMAESFLLFFLLTPAERRYAFDLPRKILSVIKNT